jgi:hypothetical protein
VNGGSGGARVTRLLGRKPKRGRYAGLRGSASLSASLAVAAFPWFRSVAACEAIKRGGVGGWVGDATGCLFLHLGRAPQAARSSAPGPTASETGW